MHYGGRDIDMLEYIYFNLVKRDIEKIDQAATIRGRTRSGLLTLAFKKATSDFASFDVADKLSQTPTKTPRGYQVYIRLTPDEKRIVIEESGKRDRSLASLVYTVIRLATRDFVDFSLVDNGKHEEASTNE